MTLHSLHGTAGHTYGMCCCPHTCVRPQCVSIAIRWLLHYMMVGHTLPASMQPQTTQHHWLWWCSICASSLVNTQGAVCGVHVMWLICMQPSHRMSWYSHMYTCGALDVQCGCTMCTSTRHELQCMHRIRRSWPAPDVQLWNPHVVCNVAHLVVLGSGTISQIDTHMAALCGVVAHRYAIQPSHANAKHIYTCGAWNVQCMCTLGIGTLHGIQWMHRIQRSWCAQCIRLRNPFVECNCAQILVWGDGALGQIGTNMTKLGVSRGQVTDFNRRYSSPFRCLPLHCRGGPRLHRSYNLTLFIY